jgi:hypothetical protein
MLTTRQYSEQLAITYKGVDSPVQSVADLGTSNCMTFLADVKVEEDVVKFQGRGVESFRTSWR